MIWGGPHFEKHPFGLKLYSASYPYWPRHMTVAFNIDDMKAQLWAGHIPACHLCLKGNIYAAKSGKQTCVLKIMSLQMLIIL